MVRESNTHIENPRIIFRETFNSEADCRRRGGTPTDVTFSNGVGVFDGTSSEITYTKLHTGPISMRIRLRMNAVGSTGYVCDFRSLTNATSYVLLNVDGTLISSGTQYVDGTAGGTIALDYEYHEIVIAHDGTNPSNLFDVTIGRRNTTKGGSHFLEADFDLVEIYNYALTAEEVSNLYSNRRHTELTGQTEILNISAQSGSIIDRWGATITNTATTVVKDGEARCMLFDGATSKVDCGDLDDLIGDKTVFFWSKVYGHGEGSFGNFINNGGVSFGVNTKFIIYLYSAAPGTIYVRSNIGGGAASVSSAYSINEWFFFALTRTAAGIHNFYINGAASGTADQDKGAPEVGTTNLTIGNNSTGGRTFDGLINDVRIYESILSTSEISQLWSTERSRYAI